MSLYAGDGDEQGQQGRGRTTNIGKSFMKRLALRIRGGIATPESTTSSQASIREEPVDELVVDEEEAEPQPGEAEAVSSLAEVNSRSDSNVRDVDVARSSYLCSAIPQPLPQNDITTVPIPRSHMRGVEQYERTRRLLAKYGLSIEAQDWMPTALPTTVLRVEKPIRMRVRYTCHMCEHPFGVERNCKTCDHKRCADCPRHPSRRNKMTSDGNKENFEFGKNTVTARKREHEELERNTHSRSRGESQAISDEPTPVMQFFQHSCHKCKTTFEQRGRLCNSCGHWRCARCPRDLAEWKQSVSREEQLRPERVYRQPRQRIRWICDHCQSTFTEGNRVCAECLHKRCDACQRIPYVSLLAPATASSANIL
jgi:hypothetical protein